MAPPEAPSTLPLSKPKWRRLTPGHFVLGLSLVEGALLLSERFAWFAFNAHKGWTVLIALAVVVAAVLLLLVWFVACLLLRRRFQFSLRLLLLFTLVVAVPCSWLAVTMKQARKQKATVEMMWTLGCIVFHSAQDTPLERMALVRKFLGDDFFKTVYSVEAGDRKFFDILGYFDANNLLFWNKSGRHIANGDLDSLANFPQLEELDLFGTQITDAGLPHMERLTSLRKLTLDCTEVTNVGLKHLAGLKQLQSLSLRDTKATQEGIQRLQQALPACEIDCTSWKELFREALKEMKQKASGPKSSRD